jgi:hypothetical protein
VIPLGARAALRRAWVFPIPLHEPHPAARNVKDLDWEKQLPMKNTFSVADLTIGTTRSTFTDTDLHHFGSVLWKTTQCHPFPNQRRSILET